MNREPHSPNNASMNINWFKETRAIPQCGKEYFKFDRFSIEPTTYQKVMGANTNNLLLFSTVEAIKKQTIDYIKNKIP